jgi:hypothetical protein
LNDLILNFGFENFHFENAFRSGYVLSTAPRDRSLPEGCPNDDVRSQAPGMPRPRKQRGGNEPKRMWRCPAIRH